jgi:ABC-type anion transport system duplicated permease subunit
MKKVGLLLAAAVLALTAYNTWQIRRLAVIVDRRRAEASAAARLEQALTHTRRARSLLRQREAGQASAELDSAIRDVSVAAARSRQGGRSLVMSVRQGFSRATQRLRKALKHGKKERRA